MHPGKLKKDEDEQEEEFTPWDPQQPSGVALSLNGKYIYVMTDHDDHQEYSDSETDGAVVVEVTSIIETCVFNEGNILHSQTFSYPFSPLPVREGVLIYDGDDKLALWDFELSKCFRTFAEVDCAGMLFIVSDDLVGCLGDWLENGSQKVNVLSISSAEIVFTTSVQGDVTSLACNDKFQFVACSREEVPSSDSLVIVEVAVWNKGQHLWKRSVVIDDHCYIQPEAWISRNNDFVVTWNTLDQGAGVHILNASTGATIHKLLTDQITIIDCKCLSDGNHFVCCSTDKVVRLYNVTSGELISLVDIESHPYCLAASFDEPLFAVALDDIEYGLFRVHLPEVQVRKEERKRIKLQS
ncbi:hypothetical protein ACROYT_G030975 [Oculina patagonica]